MKKNILILFLACVSIINAQEENFKIKNSTANSAFSDFGVSYYGKKSVVFASSRKDKTIKKRIWINNKQPYLDLYQADIVNNGDLENVRKFSKKLNSKFHDADVAFTKDLKTVYFSRNNYLNNVFKKDTKGENLIQLYKAEVNENGEWTNIEPMPFNSDNYQTGHPALNNAEDKLYFISDMPGSIGLTDIYVVDIHADGTYGNPKNLGPTVNTAKREMFPFMDKNNILYYSSDGFEDSKAGLDIYASKLRMNGTFSPPKNLGFPINSTKDDFGIVFNNEGNSGYFSSNREGGKGDDDIYSFVELNPIELNCKELIEGVVKEKGTDKLIPNATIVLMDAKGNQKESMVSDENATFSFNVDCDTSFKIKGSKKNYKDDSRNVVADRPLKVELNLEVKEKLMDNINPIYFDYNKSNIRNDAAIELDKVVEIMHKFPKIKIEGESHTDSRGSDIFNKKLSARRANATVNYIISKGINPNRISAKGYGETQLVNKCSNGVKCTEAEHQKNRRTEFVIVNPGVINE